MNLTRLRLVTTELVRKYNFHIPLVIIRIEMVNHSLLLKLTYMYIPAIDVMPPNIHIKGV